MASELSINCIADAVLCFRVVFLVSPANEIHNIGFNQQIRVNQLHVVRTALFTFTVWLAWMCRGTPT